MDAILSLILAVLMYGSIPVGTGVQVVAMVRRRGWGLVLSVVPVLPMAWVLAITWRAYRDG
ncbi:MAG TPA: hypothetical protein VK146_02445, partial [Tabrizicola sp.]|nr:hypothetical protein [Tabrizicola sp.]